LLYPDAVLSGTQAEAYVSRNKRNTTEPAINFGRIVE
jgi:hypothetical protein